MFDFLDPDSIIFLVMFFILCLIIWALCTPDSAYLPRDEEDE